MGTYLTGQSAHAAHTRSKPVLAKLARSQLKPESVDQPNEIDHRSGTRLLAQTCTVDFYRAMADAELSTNLLIGQPCCDQFHHFAFTWAQSSAGTFCGRFSRVDRGGFRTQRE